MLSDTEHRIREIENLLRVVQYNARVLATRTDKVEFDVKVVRPAPAGDPGSSCPGTLTVFVKCGSSTPIPGRSVSITDGTTTLTGTTNSSGIVTFTPGVAGAWTGTASGTGVSSVGFSFTWACANQSVTVTMNGLVTLTGSIQGCNFEYLPGALVTITSGATTLGTATTDSGGIYSIPAFEYTGGALTITGTRSRFEAKIQTYTPPCHGNGGLSFTMIPANDYYCDPCGGPIPIYKTLNGTSSKGSFSLNYDTDLGYWTGTQAVSAYVNTDCQYITPFGGTIPTCYPTTGTVTLFWEYGNLGGLFFRCYNCKPGVTVCSYVCPVDDSYRAAHPSEVDNIAIGGGIGCGTTHVNFPFALSGSDTGTLDCGIPLGPDRVPLAGSVSLSE